MRWMNRIATAMTLLAVVTVPPLLAALWYQQHPWHTPTRTEMQAWADQPLTAGTIVAGCAGVAGLAWLLLVTYLAARTGAALSQGVRRWWRRRRDHLPVLTPARLTAGSLAGVAAFTGPAVPAAGHAPAAATTGTPHAADQDVLGHDASDQAASQPAGFALPGGGWIPYRTATTIAALTAATWLYRRRHYRPDPHQSSDHRTDPDLQPLPDTVHTITTALNDTTVPGRPSPRPAGHDALPHGILHLAGPGAAVAARGLLVTTALSHAVGGHRIDLLVRADDLNVLLPGWTPADLAGTGIRTTDQMNESDRADPDRERDVITIQLGDTADVTGRWHVAADGTATGTDLTEPRRLCSLTPDAAHDLLTVTRPTPPITTGTQPTHVSATPTPEKPGTTGAHLALLGGCLLTVAGKPVHLNRTAGLQVLAYLAVHPNGATRNELTHAIWPHLPASTIAQRLHTTIADLRKQLRPLIGDDPITRHDDRYRLNTAAISTDLLAWRTSHNAAAHAVDTSALLHACQSLADLYQGELCAGWSWEWLTPPREQIRRTAIDAHSALADHADANEALVRVQQALTVDPHNEILAQRAAELLLIKGDGAGVALLTEDTPPRLPPAEPGTDR
jgi:DNA-binding SARP family transcriptional activator